MKTTMKKSVAKVITMALVLMLMVSLAVPAMATSVSQSSVEAKQGVVQIQIWFSDPETATELQLSSGTGFLINEDTVLTAEHVVTGFPDEFYRDWALFTSQELGRERTAKEIKENLQLRISVLRDVYVEATVKKVSSEMDFAVLTLNEKMYDRTTLPLRKSSEMTQTESIFALGFPSVVSHVDDQQYYDANDVTITSGAVNKVTRSSFMVEIINPLGDPELREYRNVDVVEHSATVTPGNSGGPLVDEHGNVVGLNVASNDAANMYAAVSMDPIMQTLDALGIKYDNAAAPAPVETQPAVVETQAHATEPVVTEPPVTEPPATQPPVVETQPSVVQKEEPGINMTTILIVAAVAVVAVIVVIIIIMSKGKKNQQQPVYAGATGSFTPQTNTYTATMGAGETTVLGGDAGATTVLSRGGSLIRKRTNETIVINAERFIIGRERKTANYCVADNSSVSRSHVTLITRGGMVFLMDMNAANGTFVNGVKVMPNQEVALKNGDKIKLADEEFEFRA